MNPRAQATSSAFDGEHLVSPIHFRVAFEACKCCLGMPFPSWAMAIVNKPEQHAHDEWLPLSWLNQLYKELVQVSGKANLGALIVMTPALNNIGLLPSMVLNAPDLRTAIEVIEQYTELIQERAEVRLEAGRHTARLIVSPICTSPEGMRCRTDMTLLGMTMLFKIVGVGESSISRTSFPYPRPLPMESTFELFDGDLFFTARHGELTFQPELLSKPIPGADPLIFNSLRMRAELALAELRGQRGLLKHLTRLLNESMHESPSMARVAEKMGMHERTLRRNLQHLGVTYSDLLERTRIERAKALISRGQLTLQQVASETGYSNVSSFHRAFVRVAGLTPGAWRKQ